MSPVIAGGTWLGDDDPRQSLTLQLRLPISAEELAAALYEDDQLRPADLSKMRTCGDLPQWRSSKTGSPHDDP